jgi:general secretion pathway protein H
MRTVARAERGFTLIELVVAMSVLVLLLTVTVMSADAVTGQKAKSASAELAGAIRSLYDTAALTGKTCRLVFELPAEGDDEGAATYSAQCAVGAITTSRDRDTLLRDAARSTEEDSRRTEREQREAEARRASDSPSGEPSLEDLMAQEQQRVEAQSRFEEYRDSEIPERKLPAAVRLSVWTKHQREAATSGTAYLYFFPQGYTERAQIGVRQGNNAWTVTVAPLTGKTGVVAELLEVPR